jgi:HAD superfamily hydrolase (TIGR01509 family)
VTLSAVLWDMDGLLVDTEPLWTVAESELARSLGGEFTPQAKAAMVGTRLDVAVPLLLASLGLSAEPARVADAMAWLLQRMVELYATPLELLPGAEDLLAELRSAQIPVALVSSSYRVLVEAVLAHGTGPFPITVAGDEVAHGKPDPEPYLRAAELLQVHPADCVVLEDSPAGVASGLAAGCAVVAVPSVAGVVLEERGRLVVVDQLVEATVDRLHGLVSAASGSGRTAWNQADLISTAPRRVVQELP